jgi:LmbE family N-acetylglucosaminyl deacetylase
MPLRLDTVPGSSLRVLVLGAHPDDIEIGCAGTLMGLASRYDRMQVTWRVFSGTEGRAREARKSAERLLDEAGSLDVQVLDFRDGYFPDQRSRLKDVFEELKRGSTYDVVFTHHGRDRHQDHHVLARLTWQTFRRHLVLEYEIPKYDGDLGQPNVYVPLTRETARAKARHVVESFPSQRSRPWFEEDTFLALSRLRGVECRAEEAHAEAFHGRKILFTG